MKRCENCEYNTGFGGGCRKYKIIKPIDLANHIPRKPSPFKTVI